MEFVAHKVIQTPLTKGTLVVRCALKSKASSRKTRLRARELAWDWVGAKWPRLLPSPAEREKAHLEYALPGRRLSVSTSDDGLVWTLEVTSTERDGARTWRTRAMVADAGDVDVIGLQTTCSSDAGAPLVIAPPKLLGAWVQNLEFDDGGIPVLGDPRMVEDEEQLSAFYTHLLSDARSLPVIALTNKPGSRFYGVDPRGLAEAVRGLAHVTCIAPVMAGALNRRLTRSLGPAPGAARIYRPGFTATAVGRDHPLIREPSVTNAGSASDQGAFRRLLSRRICELSAVAVDQLRQNRVSTPTHAPPPGAPSLVPPLRNPP